MEGVCFHVKEGPGDSKDPRDTEVRMGGTGDKLKELAIKFWAYLSVYRTEHGSEISSCLYFRKSVLRTRSWLKLQQRLSHTNTTLQGQSKSSEEEETEEMREHGKLAGRSTRCSGVFSQWGSVAHGMERIEMDCSVLFHWFLCGEPHQIAFL